MASKHRNEVAVGLTVLAVLALATYVVVTLGNWSDLATKQKEITVELPYKVGLKGLVKGSPIYLGGAKIGQISEARIVLPENQSSDIQVRFKMIIPKIYPLRDDCTLESDSNLLGGQVSLVIYDLGQKGKLLEDGEVAALHFSGGLTDAMDAFKRELDAENTNSLMYHFKNEFNRDAQGSFIELLVKSATNLHEITDKIKQQLAINGEKESLIAKLDTAMDKLNSSLDQIESLVRENKGSITDTVSSLKKTAEALESDLPDIMARLRKPLAKADLLMDDTKIALADLKEASRTARDMVQVNRESINHMIDNFHQVSSNMKLATQEIRRAPWKLIQKPGKKQLRQEEVVHAADSFATAAERLDGVSLRLQKILAQTEEADSQQVSLRRETVDVILAELEVSFQQFQEAEKLFWDKLE